MFGNSTIIIFGGTGSIGTLIANKLLTVKPHVSKLLLFSNNENELWESKNYFASKEHPLTTIEYMFGDIRDKPSVKTAVENADFVFNCAALKHIGFCENAPIDAVKTNIRGLMNIIEACNNASIKLMVQISTDKAVEPTSIMGATKMIGERLCKKGGCMKAVIRLGNVLNSRGSLLPQLEKYMESKGQLFITHPDMKRYFITQPELADFIIKVCKHAVRGDTLWNRGNIYIPKMDEVAIMDLVKEFCNQKGINPKITFFGKGDAEKLSEKLYSQSEVNMLHEFDDMYILGVIP